jgi:hypothetical protein
MEVRPLALEPTSLEWIVALSGVIIEDVPGPVLLRKS